jgi:uncharacterized protein DUF3617
MLLASIAIARADEPQLPPLKEGLWEAHTQQIVNKNKTESMLRLCRTHEYDNSIKASMKLAGENTRKAKQCTETVTRKSANRFLSEMHCDADGSVTKVTMTFQGDTSYRMEMHVKNGKSDAATIINDRYVGPCPADMKPGDAVTGDGRRMNLATP